MLPGSPGRLIISNDLPTSASEAVGEIGLQSVAFFLGRVGLLYILGVGNDVGFRTGLPFRPSALILQPEHDTAVGFLFRSMLTRAMCCVALLLMVTLV
jgi:hypothetical protein